MSDTSDRFTAAVTGPDADGVYAWSCTCGYREGGFASDAIAEVRVADHLNVEHAYGYFNTAASDGLETPEVH